MAVVFNVLFLCTGNSARSIIAEALINDPEIGRGKFRGYSAGSQPAGSVHPLTLETLRECGLATDGLRSQSWDDFGESMDGAPKMDFVFTVCDAAAQEVCPIWPGSPVTAHWGVPDPARVTGSDADRRRAFLDTLHLLRRRIELFAALPFETLNRLALQQRVTEIGRDRTTP